MENNQNHDKRPPRYGIIIFKMLLLLCVDIVVSFSFNRLQGVLSVMPALYIAIPVIQCSVTVKLFQVLWRKLFAHENISDILRVVLAIVFYVLAVMCSVYRYTGSFDSILNPKPSPLDPRNWWSGKIME